MVIRAQTSVAVVGAIIAVTTAIIVIAIGRAPPFDRGPGSSNLASDVFLAVDEAVFVVAVIV